eukprot:SAG11_NODE_37552_length_256_cov_0.980892_1_plen_37_part_10
MAGTEHIARTVANYALDDAAMLIEISPQVRGQRGQTT